MRNHSDVTSVLLQRRDDYETKQKHKRELRLKIGTVAACFCLLAAIGFGAGYGVFEKTPVETQPQLAKGADSNVTDTVDDINKEQDIKVNVINSNTVSDSAKKLKLDLSPNDKTVLSIDEALEYYGTDIFPKVPEDLKAWEGQDKFEIYKRNGEVYYDTFCLNYSNDDFKRSVNIEGAKGDYPLSDTADWEFNDFEASKINGQEVFIALNTNTGFYFAKFMYNGVAFHIIMEGLTEDEAVSVISSLIK